MTARDPATDPHHDLRRFPQDPQARQPHEALVQYWERVGAQLPTPRRPSDPVWYQPDEHTGAEGATLEPMSTQTPDPQPNPDTEPEVAPQDPDRGVVPTPDDPTQDPRPRH